VLFIVVLKFNPNERPVRLRLKISIRIHSTSHKEVRGGPKDASGVVKHRTRLQSSRCTTVECQHAKSHHGERTLKDIMAMRFENRRAGDQILRLGERGT
jgi:hypothetical protein